MSSLDKRKVQILQAVVHDYVSTTRPVGSERLIEVYGLACKPATVRNEMADMAEMGYLTQPHTSAGRIPTNLGYRYYVDRLMDPPSALGQADVRKARGGYRKQMTEVEEILLHTCRVLSGITSYASVATDPSHDSATLRRIYLSEAGPRHVLLVALLATGQVEHRLLEMQPPEERVLATIAGMLSAELAGRGMDELSQLSPLVSDADNSMANCSEMSAVRSAIRKMGWDLSQRKIYLEGTHQFLRQPEFHDVQRLEILLNALEQRNALFKVLRRTLIGDDVTIIIGEENAYAPMQDCSVISTSYRIGRRHAGYIGVVGPTRMKYDRAAAAVGLMAKSLSQVLTGLSMA